MEIGIGVIGCGAIASAYLEDPHGREGARGGARRPRTSGAPRPSRRGIPRAVAPDALIARSGVDLVVELTIPAAHLSVNRRAAGAGEGGVLSEAARRRRRPARPLVDLSQFGAQVTPLGWAPDAFLGFYFQSRRAALRRRGDQPTVRRGAQA